MLTMTSLTLQRQDLMPGAQGALHINSAGHASFYCKYHPGMRGTMVAK